MWWDEYDKLKDWGRLMAGLFLLAICHKIYYIYYVSF